MESTNIRRYMNPDGMPTRFEAEKLLQLSRKIENALQIFNPTQYARDLNDIKTHQSQLEKVIEENPTFAEIYYKCDYVDLVIIQNKKQTQCMNKFDCERYLHQYGNLLPTSKHPMVVPTDVKEFVDAAMVYEFVITKTMTIVLTDYTQRDI